MILKNSVFRYKTIKGPLHKWPVLLKLFLLLPLSVFSMSLPPLWLFVGINAAVIIAFMCRFTIMEQFTDLKPALYYGSLMYALSVFSNIFENWTELSTQFSSLLTILLPSFDFIRITLRLVLIIQLSALLFRSTSSMEIREGLCAVERFLRRLFSHLPFLGKRIPLRARFAENISLFLYFIPEIFTNWSLINLAWNARGGKQGVKKIKTTVFVLISLSMEKAAVKAKALAARDA